MNAFNNIVDEMRRHQMKLPTQPETFCLPEARQVLADALNCFLAMEGHPLVWLPEYDEVADWLTNNGGRGLFLYGNCGRGKSLLTRYALPAIYLKHFRKVVSVYDIREMNRNLDLLLTRHYIALDDVGTEEVINHYGNRRLAFAEVMDVAEKQNKLVIVSSNLQERDLAERYGDRTVDRIRSTMRRILFAGQSLRK